MSNDRVKIEDKIDPSPPSADDEGNSNILDLEDMINVPPHGHGKIENVVTVSNTEAEQASSNSSELDSVINRNVLKDQKYDTVVTKEDIKVSQTSETATQVVEGDAAPVVVNQPQSDPNTTFPSGERDNVDESAANQTKDHLSTASVNSYGSAAHEYSLTSSMASFQDRFEGVGPPKPESENDTKKSPSPIITPQGGEHKNTSATPEASVKVDEKFKPVSMVSSQESEDAAGTDAIPAVVVTSPPSKESEASRGESFIGLKEPENKSQTMTLAVEVEGAQADSEAMAAAANTDAAPKQAARESAEDVDQTNNASSIVPQDQDID